MYNRPTEYLIRSIRRLLYKSYIGSREQYTRVRMVPYSTSLVPPTMCIHTYHRRAVVVICTLYTPAIHTYI